MKKFFIVLCLISVLGGISLWATDFTITVTVDTASASEILATVTAWRVRQLDASGNPLYVNNTALGQAILYQGLRRILRQQCEFDPTTCTTGAKAQIDARNTAIAGFDAAIDAAVTP